MTTVKTHARFPRTKKRKSAFKTKTQKSTCNPKLGLRNCIDTSFWGV